MRLGRDGCRVGWLDEPISNTDPALSALPSTCAGPDPAQPLRSRPLPPRWSEGELGWLRQQSQLRVGILQEDYRPFTMIARQRVEGLSADYIDLLARMLDKPVALSAFPDKAHLLRALARGRYTSPASAISPWRTVTPGRSA